MSKIHSHKRTAFNLYFLESATNLYMYKQNLLKYITLSSSRN